ncbi:outer membrane lipoprotein chaperone LolA [Chromobacterium amazonense]|uniref:Outer-membrane lipoprotein carrier protein n=1 Tax=Chromobacterium amazonense TaxID=1382803 RepID=A0ABU8V599_9NEIS|nr:outer membrane lipoprotein chaperone LolA [Chromobacterium amazonense]MBM2883351.1 outer membrane lipoprotein chaperone LolA [Chromobacterium amazonense]MDQ4539274.1 outer membrane lipoprotein chaperone LolA [Chromobacterium amazonense]
MKPSFPLLSAAALACCLAAPAHASAIGQLKAFVAGSKTLSADFTQIVSNKNKREEASGRLEIARPGKFRWEYTKPYAQLIVGDGKTLWIYDPDLAQVTRKAQGAALGSSPAALLAGSNEIERSYKLNEAGKQGDLEWLAASPKKQDNTFSAIRMGFRNNMLVEMELTDSFGNDTRIRFSQPQQNVNLPVSRFAFTPPKGADVVNGD